MKTAKTRRGRVSLKATTAAELMTPEPVTIPQDATLREAVRLLVDRHISAAPVVDDAGKPVGVVSRSDVVEHDREEVEHALQVPEYFSGRDLARSVGEELPRGFQVERVDRTRAREVMTPVVFSVRPEDPVEAVVRQMVAREVHRLFVVDAAGVLVGVISTMDLVRNLEA